MANRRAYGLLLAILAPAALIGCVASDDQGVPSAATALPPAAGTGPVAPPPVARPAGGAVALLAPVTGANAPLGDILVKAAQLAMADPGSPALDVRDTGSTPAGAAAAAQAAIAAGDSLIIGPLSAAETAGVAGPAVAASVPVLAFTNDSTQARAGVWTLGITPAQQVRRMVMAASAQGKQHFAAVLPQTDFGHAMGTALTQATTASGLTPADLHFHDESSPAIASMMRDVSGYADRRGPLDAQIKAARARHDAEGRKIAADLSRQPIPPAPFDALLLADTGEKLAWLTSFLPYYDIDAPAVQVMGPALWALPAARAGAAITGAWYAAPDPAARAAFDQAFTTKYGAPAPGLADLAYDAASIGRVLAQAGGATPALLCRPDGFAGVDGVVGLLPDGGVRRGLALFQIQAAGPVMIEPAPATLGAPGT